MGKIAFTLTVMLGLVAAGGRPVATDPARLARIRAAKMPPITKPVMFNTPEADAILSALEVFPPDNPWNQVVSDWPVHPNSRNIIASIGADKPLRYNPDMGFVLVPPDQKKGRRRDRRLSRRVGPWSVSGARQPADRRLAGLRAARCRLPGLDAGRYPTRPGESWRRPAWDRGRSGQPAAVRILCRQEDGPRLEGDAGVDVRPENEPVCGRTAGPRPTPPACLFFRPWSATTN